MQLAAWFCIQGLAGITFFWDKFLAAGQVYHPARIMKREPGNSFNSEDAYIAFSGCGRNNKSLIDELPIMMAQLLELRRQIEALSKDYSNFKGLVEYSMLH